MPHAVRALLDGAERFVLTTHARPDGDAIGSVLALALYLRGKGKHVDAIICDPTPFNLEWLPGADTVELFDGSLRQLEAIAAADVIGILDANAAHRVGAMARAVKGSPATKLLVDHHTDPEGWFDVSYVRESASSTGELIHELIVADDSGLVTPEIAQCLYAAVVTDTGSFRFSNVTPQVHRMVADILERGQLDPSVLHARIYDRKSLGSLHLLASLLRSLDLAHDGQVASALIDTAMLQEAGASIDETDGYVNWGLAIDGVRVSILFTETERGTKASFRSKGSDQVHRWAQTLGGGGHPNAAGAFIRKPAATAIPMVLEQAPRFIDLKSAAEADSDLTDEDLDYLAMLQSRSR